MKKYSFWGVLLTVLLMMLLSHGITGQQVAAESLLLPLTPPCGTLGGSVVYADPMDTIGAGGWHIEWGDGAAMPVLETVSGYNGQALRLTYDLGSTKGAWVQVHRDFATAQDWSDGDHLRFIHQGTQPNSIEIGLVSNEVLTPPDYPNYFGSSWNSSTHVPWWTYATWDLKDFFRTDQQRIKHPFPDLSQVNGVFISVVNKAPEDRGGTGSFILDDLAVVNISSRAVPTSFDPLPSSPAVTQAAQQAAAWVAARQQPSGLLKSWQEEVNDFSWLYDQALGLIVLSQTDIARAGALAAELHTLQNGDGSWYSGYHYNDGAAITNNKDIGPIAWLVYALTVYYPHEPDSTKAEAAYQDARQGAGWLASRQGADGSLSGSITEWNLDVWWAFQAADYTTQANRLKNYLLGQVWDSEMGRFRSSANTRQIFLDNQTWGAAFLRAVEHDEDARKALSYARSTLLTTSSDGGVCGFDGAGPFSVWNEGTLQYIAAGGENSPYYWAQMVAQQAGDGGMPNSPEPVVPIAQNPNNCTDPADENFCAYIVWLSHWHGIAPTAWLYFAATGGPYPPYPPASRNAAPLRNYHTTATPVLTWNHVSNATTYEVQVDSSITFTLPLDFSAEVPGDTLSVITTALTNGTYFWRVRAKFANGTVGAWSATDRFIVDVP